MKIFMLHVGSDINYIEKTLPKDINNKLYIYRKSLFDDNPQPFLKHEIINTDAQIQSIKNLGVEVVYRIFTNRASLTSLFIAGKKIREICKNKKIDILHSQWGSTASFISVIFAPCPVLISFCGTDLLGEKNRDGKITLKGYLIKILSIISSLFAKNIIVKSEEMIFHLPKILSSKINVIPNGIDTKFFYPMPMHDAKSHIGFDHKKKYIMFFFSEGQVVKNPDMATEVFRMVKNNYPDAVFFIATGLNYEDLVYYYNASHVLIHTSFHEGSNNSIKEALSCNLPIVSVNVGDAGERLRNVNNCFVLDSYDPIEFASKVEELLYLDERSNGHKFIKEISIENTAKKVAKVYEEIQNG